MRGPFYQAEATAHVVAPPRGRSVLACRCRRMLDLVDMHRPPQRDVPGGRAGTAIDPIMCARCAKAERSVPVHDREWVEGEDHTPPNWSTSADC